jgi:Ca-activated chloride channel family protein
MPSGIAGQWPRMSPRKWIGATAVAIVAITAGIAGIAAGRTGHEASKCTAPAPLAIVAAPEISAVVTGAARIAGLADPATSNCVHPTVTAGDPAEVAATLAADRADRPDVWIPDSSIWLRREALAAAGLPAGSPSVARSPAVLALPRALAARLGAHPGDGAFGFGPLLPADSGAAQPVQLRLPDPRRSAPTVGALVGLQAATAGRADQRAVLAAVLRASDRGATDAALGARQAEPSSEQQVWLSNQPGGTDPLVAAYPPGAGIPLDYPFVILATRHEQRAAANRLLSALRGELGRQLLDAAGFREPGGHAGPALTAARGVDPAAAGTGAVPPAAAIETAIRALEAVNLPSRLLAVLDVSGSMALPASPGAPTTRLDLARTAVLGGLALYPDDTEVGLWTFAAELAGETDYREVVPIVPLGRDADGGTGRLRLADALPALRVSRRGGTGLYDTALAAVRAVRRSWDPNRVNSVVLLTDGRDEDRVGISLSQLLKTLRDERDPKRPVYLITIAYGPDADNAALRAMSRATGAEMYSAVDPLRLRAVLLDAIGRRICRPTC